MVGNVWWQLYFLLLLLLQVGDQLVSVDGKSLVGVNQFQAAQVLNLTGPEVEITVGRDPEPGEDQVFQIIQQTNSTTEEDTQDSREESPKSMNDLMLTEDGKKLFCFDLEKVNVSVSAVQAEEKPEEDNPPTTLAGVKKLSENMSICDVNDLLEDDAEELDKVSDEEEEGSPSNEPIETAETEDDPSEGGKNLVKTSVIVLNQENIPTSSELAGPACCPYKDKYESLLGRLERSENLVRQLSNNLKTVRSQLLSRDQTIQLYVENVEQLINQVHTEIYILTDNFIFNIFNL